MRHDDYTDALAVDRLKQRWAGIPAVNEKAILWYAYRFASEKYSLKGPFQVTLLLGRNLLSSGGSSLSTPLQMNFRETPVRVDEEIQQSRRI